MKRYLVVVLAVVLVILARPYLYGNDSYFYAAIACGHNQAASHESILTQNFSFFPCDWSLFKITLAFLSILSLALLWKVGELFDKTAPENYALLFLLNPLLHQVLFNFEDDAFGLPFLLVSLYFYIRFLQEKKVIFVLIAIGTALAGFVFWKAIGIWLIILCLSWFWSLIPAFWAIYTQGAGLIWSINREIAEHQVMLEGLLLQLLFFLIGIIEITPAMLPSVFFAGLLAFLSTKYSLWLGLLLAIGTAWYAKRKMLFFWNKRVRDMVFWIPLAMCIPYLFLAPTADNIRFVQHAVELADGQPIINEFSMGHYLIAFGGKAVKTSGPPNPDMNADQGLKITPEEIDCPIVDRTNFLLFHDQKMYLCE